MNTAQIQMIAAARRETLAPAAPVDLYAGPAVQLARDYSTDAPLTEKYRPRTLSGIVGQAQAVAVLSSFARAPYPTAFLLCGETGTGKTTAALALAAELGCDVDREEFGGLWQIASGEQSVSNVRDLLSRLHFVPFYGRGWKLVQKRYKRSAPAIRQEHPAETVERLFARYEFDKSVRGKLVNAVCKLARLDWQAAQTWAALIRQKDEGRCPDVRPADYCGPEAIREYLRKIG